MIRDQSRQWPTMKSKISAHHVARYDFARALFREFGIKKILDAACGTGYGSAGLARYAKVTGVDVSEAAIKWAKMNFPGPEYILGDIAKSPWEGPFDGIVSLETIEHLKDPAPALDAFRKSLTGKFVASVPNEELTPFVTEHFAKDEWPHYRHYTPQEFEDLLVTHGFKVIRKCCQISKIDCKVTQGINGKFLIYVCE